MEGKEDYIADRSTRMRFELTRAEHNGLAVHRLNHSATSSSHHGIGYLFDVAFVLY